MAGVSTPTISRFENGEKDIQLSTVISILTVLGMNDQRHLIFPEPNEYYDSLRRIVVFIGRDGDRLMRCAVSIEVLADYFDGDGKDPLKVFQANHEKIEHEMRRKYLSENLETDGSILLTTKDMG
ncbi:MAG TPA: DUF1488 family protein [Gammaproteobacteria bacterium]|nr:DUF1488 family protein [Gammaproteobacteria bacterium]